ncbi:DUF721 domain-containing protein [Streptomyces venezuelae]|uniref:DUF721 domain-containing protein n=1 Tax=Streptomyces venezuelae TaxID=54571 RepID=UPI003454B6C1
MSSPEPSGVDMARAALAAARAAAKTRPALVTAKKKRPQRTSRHGRDPISFGTAITGMMDERGWEPPEAGGSILDQWPDIAPELAPHVTAVRYEHDTGTLHLRPDSPAFATQLRMFQAQLVRRIHDKTGTRTVRRLRILTPGAPTAPAYTDHTVQPDPAAAAPAKPGPVRTRETASPGYRRALEAAQTHTPEPCPLSPFLQAAVDRQTARITDPARREPAAAFTDAVAAQEHATPPTLDEAERIRRAAIARKHTGDQPVRRAFDVA